MQVKNGFCYYMGIKLCLVRPEQPEQLIVQILLPVLVQQYMVKRIKILHKHLIVNDINIFYLLFRYPLVK